jgi:predicted nuclease of restriction endonuclease-like (RecB) superfamily
MASQRAPVSAAGGDFEALVSAIVHIHEQTQAFSTKAVNVALTLRNWLIGYRIEVYERQGLDRATYGDKLMDTLAKRLVKQGWARCDRRELYRFRQLYLTYPQIVESLTPQSLLLPELGQLLALASPPTAQIRESVTPQLPPAHPELIFRLSFTHLAELIQLADDTQRRFYEVECMRGNWSVRELRRQIDSLYYERSGLSKDKAQLSALAHATADTLQPAHVIRDPYVFEFLGLRSRDVMAESDLEDLNNQVFVSRYAVELPRKEEMEHFITQINREVGPSKSPPMPTKTTGSSSSANSRPSWTWKKKWSPSATATRAGLSTSVSTKTDSAWAWSMWTATCSRSKTASKTTSTHRPWDCLTCWTRLAPQACTASKSSWPAAAKSPMPKRNTG